MLFVWFAALQNLAQCSIYILKVSQRCKPNVQPRARNKTHSAETRLLCKLDIPIVKKIISDYELERFIDL